MAILGISNKEQIGYSLETTWGTTVAANPIKLFRFVSGSFKNETGNTKSAEIQNNREIADIIRTKFRGSGSINFELSYGVLDDLLEGLTGGTWTINGAGPTYTLKVGTTRKSFTFERQFTDIARFHAYKGAIITALSLNVGVGKVIDGSLSFMSIGGSDGVATAGTGTTAVTTGTIMNPIDSVQAVVIGGTTITGVSDFSIGIAQTAIDFEQIGSINPADMRIGSFEVTGSFSCFYDDTLNTAMIAAANGWTDSSASFTLGGAAAQKYAILFNKVKLVNPEIANPGMNQPLMAKYSFSAKVDAANTTMSITRTP